MDSLSRTASIGMWALLTLPLAFLGFSSTAVIVLVLFSGGFMMGVVLWRSLAKVLGASEEAAKPLEEETEARDRKGCLMVISVIAFGSLAASFIMGYYRLHETGALGVALVFGNSGLLLGVLPAVSWILGIAGGNRDPHASQFRPLLRDVLYLSVIAGLIGYEISLAAEGGEALSSIPTFVLLVVLLGYLGVLGRSLLSRGGKLEPHKPLLAASFGMLLLFSPLVVLLSNPPATVARLYGAAQAAGLVAVVVYIGVAQRWQKELQSLSARLQEAVNRGVSVRVTIGSGEEAASQGGKGRRRRRRLFRRG